MSTTLPSLLLFVGSGPGLSSRCGDTTLSVCPSLNIFECSNDIRTPPLVKKASRHMTRVTNASKTSILARLSSICRNLSRVRHSGDFSVKFGEVTPRFGSFQFDLTPGFWDVLASPYDADVGAFHRTDREPTSAAPRSILHDAPGLSGVDLVAFWSQI